MSLSTTTIADWVYVGEGGANIVFSYRGPRSPLFTGKVLRLRKRALSSEPSRSEDGQHLLHLETVPPKHLPREWLEALAKEVEASRPVERRVKDAIDLQNPRPVLATDLVGGNGIAVEIKVRPRHRQNGAFSHPRRISRLRREESRRRRAGSACIRTFAAYETAYCPLDLYSGDEDRMRTALEALWDGWERSGGEGNNFRVFLDGKRLAPGQTVDRNTTLSSLLSILQQTPLLRTLSHLQRTLDALDIEGLATLVNLDDPGPEPTRAEWDAFIAAFVATSPGAFSDRTRYHTLAYLLSATFKDCSLIVRISEGTATLIDLDVKSLTRLRKWEKMDREIVEAYMKVPVVERKHCVDGL
ncbi:Inositol-pentakisphosphate 2-kinase [Mycena chlorophos]|uniref:Inositol-pentakisphosphate 2-kinase n=1 Tax=Mycena chlorophos TaxID=658473 RepID=A0A8H6TEL3_MYCCL|nr:Inositol-pentakisphosphate 2-kinase [Mycena chlorophos]